MKRSNDRKPIQRSSRSENRCMKNNNHENNVVVVAAAVCSDQFGNAKKTNFNEFKGTLAYRTFITNERYCLYKRIPIYILRNFHFILLSVRVICRKYKYKTHVTQAQLTYIMFIFMNFFPLFLFSNMFVNYTLNRAKYIP